MMDLSGPAYRSKQSATSTLMGKELAPVHTLAKHEVSLRNLFPDFSVFLPFSP